MSIDAHTTFAGSELSRLSTYSRFRALVLKPSCCRSSTTSTRLRLSGEPFATSLKLCLGVADPHVASLQHCSPALHKEYRRRPQTCMLSLGDFLYSFHGRPWQGKCMDRPENMDADRLLKQAFIANCRLPATKSWQSCCAHQLHNNLVSSSIEEMPHCQQFSLPSAQSQYAGSHWLRIETGRHNRTDKQDRTCPMCPQRTTNPGVPEAEFDSFDFTTSIQPAWLMRTSLCSCP